VRANLLENDFRAVAQDVHLVNVTILTSNLIFIKKNMLLSS